MSVFVDRVIFQPDNYIQKSYQLASDGSRLVWVLFGQTSGFSLQITQFVLDGSQVALHACQLALQRHDACQVVAQLLCGLDHLCLLPDPGLGLIAVQVIVLHAQSRLEQLFLAVHKLTELAPPKNMEERN